MVFVHTASAQGQSGGDETRVLFDGTSLDAWRGYSTEEIGSGWKVEDGAIHFDGSGGGDIVSREEFADFELSFEWKVTEGANSGVMYRVGLGEEAPYDTGPEYQILDDQRHVDGKNPLTSAASLYALYAPIDKQLCPVGEWNQAKIVVEGNRIEHWLNGRQVVEAEIGSADWNARVANSKFKEWKKFASLDRGRICLQDHGDDVWFRDIRVKLLNPSAKDQPAPLPQR
jgi:hypothetical protein